MTCVRNPYAKSDKGNEQVNHPAHYNVGDYECIDVMIDVYGINAVMDFCKLNAFKYIWRADSKNGEEDIRKAHWYMDKYLELLGECDM